MKSVADREHGGEKSIIHGPPPESAGPVHGADVVTERVVHVVQPIILDARNPGGLESLMRTAEELLPGTGGDRVLALFEANQGSMRRVTEKQADLSMTQQELEKRAPMWLAALAVIIGAVIVGLAYLGQTEAVLLALLSVIGGLVAAVYGFRRDKGKEQEAAASLQIKRMEHEERMKVLELERERARSGDPNQRQLPGLDP